MERRINIQQALAINFLTRGKSEVNVNRRFFEYYFFCHWATTKQENDLPKILLKTASVDIIVGE